MPRDKEKLSVMINNQLQPKNPENFDKSAFLRIVESPILKEGGHSKGK